MEWMDILDAWGEPTGLTIKRGDPLQDGQYYLGVHAYIYNARNEFLLQRRALDKKFLPGGWDVHMGHVLARETSRDGIVREIREEIGLRFPKDDIRLIGRVAWEAHHHLADIYFLRINFEIEELSYQKEEVIGLKLVSADEMLSLVSNMDYRPMEYRKMVSYEISKLIGGE